MQKQGRIADVIQEAHVTIVCAITICFESAQQLNHAFEHIKALAKNTYVNENYRLHVHVHMQNRMI